MSYKEDVSIRPVSSQRLTHVDFTLVLLDTASGTKAEADTRNAHCPCELKSESCTIAFLAQRLCSRENQLKTWTLQSAMPAVLRGNREASSKAL